MPKIFNLSELTFTPRQGGLPEFTWQSSERLGQLAGSGKLVFDLRALDPGKFSFPYHFHRHAEELFYIISGACTLRTPDGFTVLKAGALVHFEEGPSSAHQLYNHTDGPCVYLDLRTAGPDVTEYPDSGKIGLLPGIEVFRADAKVLYTDGEENVRRHWPKEIMGG